MWVFYTQISLCFFHSLQLLLGLKDVGKVKDIRDKYLNPSMSQAVDHRELIARLDQKAGSWDKETAGRLIALSLKCMKSTREDRPDLEKDIIPELSRMQISGIEASPLFPNISDEDRTKLNMTSIYNEGILFPFYF